MLINVYNSTAVKLLFKLNDKLCVYVKYLYNLCAMIKLCMIRYITTNILIVF